MTADIMSQCYQVTINSDATSLYTAVVDSGRCVYMNECAGFGLVFGFGVRGEESSVVGGS